MEIHALVFGLLPLLIKEITVYLFSFSCPRKVILEVTQFSPIFPISADEEERCFFPLKTSKQHIQKELGVMCHYITDGMQGQTSTAAVCTTD